MGLHRLLPLIAVLGLGSAPATAVDVQIYYPEDGSVFEQRDALANFVHAMSEVCDEIVHDLANAALTRDESERIQHEHYEWKVERDNHCREIGRSTNDPLIELECLVRRTEARYEELSDARPASNRAPVPLISIEAAGWHDVAQGYGEGACDFDALCESLEAGASGIEVRFSISKQGMASEVQLSGECGVRADVTPVLQTVAHWRYNPSIRNGRAADAPHACILFRTGERPH